MSITYLFGAFCVCAFHVPDLIACLFLQPKGGLILICAISLRKTHSQFTVFRRVVAARGACPPLPGAVPRRAGGDITMRPPPPPPPQVPPAPSPSNTKTRPGGNSQNPISQVLPWPRPIPLASHPTFSPEWRLFLLCCEPPAGTSLS